MAKSKAPIPNWRIAIGNWKFSGAWSLELRVLHRRDLPPENLAHGANARSRWHGSFHNVHNVRRIYYFSLEYLMGRLFGSNLLATGLHDTARSALAALGQDFDTIRESEVDMGLGNGGLGRLAACFLDSLATLDYPALG